ncbi:hypothetical protein EVAR_57270_1 [Eumeta japonica]|uniref:Uncharacterized protein n=1 Tax=Eumeta variegata TaxID=151549 RepID=A0A4C1ZUW1_EUMVA|nr:hypothetical protein EVAR_57270_1 [Eumeta japonica]
MTQLKNKSIHRIRLENMSRYKNIAMNVRMCLISNTSIYDFIAAVLPLKVTKNKIIGAATRIGPLKIGSAAKSPAARSPIVNTRAPSCEENRLSAIIVGELVS